MLMLHIRTDTMMINDHLDNLLTNSTFQTNDDIVETILNSVIK